MAWQTAIALILIGMIGLFAYLYFRLDNEHHPIKLLFFVISLWFGLLAIHYGMTLLELNSTYTALENILQVAYSSLMWINIFIMAYVVIYYLIKVIQFMLIKQQEERQVRY